VKLDPRQPLWLPEGSVRAIVALVLVTVLSILTLQGQVTGEAFLTIVAAVVAFYFGQKQPPATGER
jgi:hypothetical protein